MVGIPDGESGLNINASPSQTRHGPSSQPVSVQKRGNPPFLVLDKAPPQAYKMLPRKTSTEPPSFTTKYPVGDGFSVDEVSPSGTAQVARKRRSPPVATGLGPLELTQSTQAVKQATRPRKRKLDGHIFDIEDRAPYLFEQHKSDGSVNSTASVLSRHKAHGSMLGRLSETGKGRNDGEQGEPSQNQNHSERAPEDTSPGTRRSDSCSTPFYVNQDLKLKKRGEMQDSQVSFKDILRNGSSRREGREISQSQPALPEQQHILLPFKEFREAGESSQARSV